VPTRDRHVQIALVHTTLAVATGVLGEWPGTTWRSPEEDDDAT
jgi:hypothetical protein